MTAKAAAGPQRDPAGRLWMLDGMRGIAAVMVLLFHLLRNSPYVDALAAAVPTSVQGVLDLGRSGVAVFFVLSGFVIGHTTRELSPRVADGVRYSVRRQVRLDPPYYATVAVVLVLAAAERLVPGQVYESYTVPQVVANLLYLQGILDVEPILAVAWTLCFEVQFYLLVVLIHLVSSRLGRDETSRRRWRAGLAASLAVLSLAAPFVSWSFGPWALGAWWMFALGLALSGYAARPAQGRGPVVAVLAVALWVSALQVTGRADPHGGEWFALATAVLILGLIHRGRLAARPSAALLWLGRISYSLYLVHLPVIGLVLGALFKLTGPSPAAAVTAYLVGAGAALVAAWGLHVAVERPAMRWSRRVGVGQRVA